MEQGRAHRGATRASGCRCRRALAGGVGFARLLDGPALRPSRCPAHGPAARLPLAARSCGSLGSALLCCPLVCRPFARPTPRAGSWPRRHPLAPPPPGRGSSPTVPPQPAWAARAGPRGSPWTPGGLPLRSPVRDKALAPGRPQAGYAVEHRDRHALAPELAVVRNSKAVRLVPHPL